MPKSSPIQADFSGGEFGPHVEGRVDVEKHKTGMEEVLNYIPTLEGPLTRRPGTKYVADAKDPSKPPVFIPFKVSNTEQYIIEAGERYFRFFTDGERVLTNGTSYIVSGRTNPVNRIFREPGFPGITRTNYPFFATRSQNTTKTFEDAKLITVAGAASDQTITHFSSSIVSGSILELPTFYDHNMIQNVSWTQKGDTLWLTHSSIPTFTLQRFGRQDWDLKYFYNKDGPYNLLNTSRSFGDGLRTSLRVYPNGPESVKVVTHSSNFIANVISTGGTDNRAEVFVRNAHGYSSGDEVWINGVFGTIEINNGSNFATSGSNDPSLSSATNSSRWRIQVTSASSFILLNSVFSNAYVGSGVVYPALFYQPDSGRNIALYKDGERYFGKIKCDSSITAVAIVNSGNQNSENLVPMPVLAQIDIDENSRMFTDAVLAAGTTIISVWQLGVYDRINGYPSAAAFHQDRLALTGVPGRPAEFAASAIGEYESFAVNEASSLVVTAKNALQFNLSSNSNDLLKWVESGQQGLCFASNSTEFLVSPSRDGEALTPTNINSDVLGFYGTGNVNPARIGDAIIYVQNSARKIRELRFFANYQTHKTTLINELADHITFPEVTRLAVQKEFYPLVWGQRSDGKLISMSYSREEESVRAGWATHELGGQSDSSESIPKVKSMEIIRDVSGKYDQLWMAVQRYINGTSVVTIEYMVEPYQHKNPTQKQRDAFYLDCGATYDSSLVIASITQGSALVTIANHGLQRNDIVLVDDVVGLNSSLLNVNQILVNSNLVNGKMFVVGSTTTNNFFLQDFNSSIVLTHTYSPYFSGGTVRKLVSTIGGLTWLKNEEVDVLADGGIHGKATVNSGGFLALNYPAAVVQVGYSYKSRGKTLVKDSGSKTGSAIGMQRKTYQVAFRLRDVGDFKYGGIDYLNMHQANLYNADEYQAHQAVPLFTGIYRDGIEQDVSFYGQVVFEQSSPLPGMIQSITYLMDEQDL